VPTVRVIYDVDGWAYHRRALALQRQAPDDLDVSIAPLRRRCATTALFAEMRDRAPVLDLQRAAPAALRLDSAG
jgi:hypothetical protein